MISLSSGRLFFYGSYEDDRIMAVYTVHFGSAVWEMIVHEPMYTINMIKTV